MGKKLACVSVLLSIVPEPSCAEGSGALLLCHPLSPGAVPPPQMVCSCKPKAGHSVPCLGVPVLQRGSRPSLGVWHRRSVLLAAVDWAGVGWAGLGWQESCLLVCVPRCAARGFAVCQHSAWMGLGTRGQSILVCRILVYTRRGFRTQLCTHLLFSP